MQSAVTLAAFINRNAITVIDVQTELGDDGLHPVVTVVPKHELMNFGWGFQVSQDPRFQKRISEGLTSDPFFLFTSSLYTSAEALNTRFLPELLCVKKILERTSVR